jgi:FkbM family methyltransferase
MNILRTVVERLARGKVIKRRLPKQFGSRPFYITPDAQLKYLKFGNSAFDSDLLQLAQTYLKKDSKVWDIGANVGVFTFAAASIATAGQVLAVEPDIWLAEILRRSCAIDANQELDVQVLPSAIADINGVSTFLIAQRGRANNSLETVGGRSQMGGIRTKILVPTLTLDTLLESCFLPDFVKIDCEGAEFIALSGGHRLLKEIRPIFYVEVGDNLSESVAALFLKYNYRIFQGSGGKAGELLSVCAFNTIAMPAEQIVYF